MEGTGIQPVMNLGSGYGYGDGCGFGGSGIWLFAILALMWGGFGGNRFGNGIDGRCATVEDLNNSANFTRLESQVQANGQAIAGVNTNLGNAICSLGYEMATKFGETDKQIAECCCGINRNIDAVRYENALNTASINANTTAGIQKVLDTLCADKIAAQQARISQLELNQALCGVVRYPTNATFAVGTPFNVGFGYGCGYNSNI
jgi:hypothetical protein